jgi:hypothetical protein
LNVSVASGPSVVHSVVSASDNLVICLPGQRPE